MDQFLPAIRRELNLCHQYKSNALRSRKVLRDASGNIARHDQVRLVVEDGRITNLKIGPYHTGVKIFQGPGYRMISDGRSSYTDMSRNNNITNIAGVVTHRTGHNAIGPITVGDISINRDNILSIRTRNTDGSYFFDTIDISHYAAGGEYGSIAITPDRTVRVVKKAAGGTVQWGDLRADYIGFTFSVEEDADTSSRKEGDLGYQLFPLGSRAQYERLIADLEDEARIYDGLISMYRYMLRFALAEQAGDPLPPPYRRVDYPNPDIVIPAADQGNGGIGGGNGHGRPKWIPVLAGLIFWILLASFVGFVVGTMSGVVFRFFDWSFGCMGAMMRFGFLLGSGSGRWLGIGDAEGVGGGGRY